jgi:hypothetical protein
MSNSLRGEVERQLTKKDQIHLAMQLSMFLLINILSKKIICKIKIKIEDMGMLIVKNHLPMQFVESLWMKCLCLHLCSKICLSFHKVVFTKDYP